MNNGYSKIRFVNTTKNSRKSRSIDFSDLYSPPQILKPFTPISKPPQPTPTTNEEPPPTLKATHDPFPSNEQHGEKFGQILSTHFPNSSKRFKNGEKQTTPSTTTNIATTTTGGVLQSAVKRAFSMRRSCSVSEGYCRIYDQSFDPSTTPINDDEDENMQKMKKKKKKNKRGSRILKACKSLFGI